MKFITAVLFFLAIFSTAPFDARAVEGAMKGIEPTYRGGNNGVSHGGTGGIGGTKAVSGTCSQAVQRCKKHFATSASACVSAGESCKQSGTFTNPQGQSFSGLTKN